MKKTYIIAEAGVNHNGSLDEALKLVSAAAKAGADAIKFQTFSTQKNYQEGFTDTKRLAWAKGLELNEKDFKCIVDACKAHNITFMSTPFDTSSVDLLDDLGVEAFKIASSEVCHYDLLKHVAQKGKPILLSTGMAFEHEIERALDVIERNWNKEREEENAAFDKVNLLYCVSLYPTPYDKVDLNVIPSLEKRFKVKTGFSDHSVGIHLPMVAVGLGAQIIEKHFKLSDTAQCPDAEVSLGPDEFAQMVQGIRNIEKSLGSGDFKLSDEELKARYELRKGLYASRRIHKGEIVKETDIIFRKPSTDLGIENFYDLIGKEILKDIEAGESFTQQHLKVVSS